MADRAQSAERGEPDPVGHDQLDAMGRIDLPQSDEVSPQTEKAVSHFATIEGKAFVENLTLTRVSRDFIEPYLKVAFIYSTTDPTPTNQLYCTLVCI